MNSINSKKIIGVILALAVIIGFPVYSHFNHTYGEPETPEITSTSLNESTTEKETFYETEKTEFSETENTTVTASKRKTETRSAKKEITEDGYYYSKDDVSKYIHKYGKLPKNFITKNQARALGWEGGSIERFKDNAAIGGDKYTNYEGTLPKKDGRKYFECDIDTHGKSSRGPKRIVFSNDGLIFYTSDHYKTFERLY